MLFLKKINDLLDPEDQQGPNGAASAADAPADGGDGLPAVASGRAEAKSGSGTSGAAAVAPATLRMPQASSQPAPDSCGPSETGSRAGSEWEVVIASEGRSGIAGAEAAAAIVEAEAAAKQLQLAARAAEALAPRLGQALRRAEEAEAEAARLATALAKAEARIEAMQAQQLRLTEGFMGEVRQRDAELAVLRSQVVAAAAEPKPAAAAGSTDSKAPASGAPGAAATASSPAAPEVAEVVDVLTFTDEGPLGVEFDQTNSCLKVIASVEPGSSACGRISVGDEVISIDGIPARGLSWEELEQALAPRPTVVSIRRAEGSALRAGGAGGALGLAGRVRNLAGWTRAAAQAAAREFEAAMADLDNTDGAAAPPGDSPEDIEARNRPFYELVRTSMAEACDKELRTGGPGARTEAAFECWLREFHNDRDDGWYTNNHTRVYKAFRPHWDEVLAAQRALAAS